MPANPTVYDFHFSLDPEAFLKQRYFLERLMNSGLLRADEELLAGLIGLTDEIADQAADEYGLPVLLERDREQMLQDNDDAQACPLTDGGGP
jgi:hypothetical protein